MKRAIDDASALFGPDSSRVGTMVRAMVAPLQALQRLPEALEASDRGLRIVAQHHPADSVHLAYALVARGSIEMALRRPARSFDDLDRAWSLLRAAMGDEQQYVLHVRMQRALALGHAGKAAEAADELRFVLDAHRKHRYPGEARVLRFLAGAQRLAGRSPQALATLAEAQAQVKTDADRQRVELEAGLNHLMLGQPAPALAAFRRADALQPANAPVTALRADILYGLGRAMLEHGQAEPALAHLKAADAFWQAQGDEHRWAGEAAYWLARCHAALGQRNEARQAFARAARLLAASPFAFDAALLERARRGA